MALTNDRGNPVINPPDFPGESYLVAGSGSSYAGGLVGLNAAGYLTKIPGPGIANNAFRFRGIAHERFVAPSATDGEIRVRVDRPGMIQGLQNLGSDAVTLADLGNTVYAEDDDTIRRTNAGGLRCAVGMLQAINPDGTVNVKPVQP